MTKSAHQHIPTSNNQKERPILFSTPMVQAILDKRKVMTRRAIKPQPDSIRKGGIPCKHIENQYDAIEDEFYTEVVPINCPYGKPGDLLWVRETWAKLVETYKDGSLLYQPKGFKYVYKADGVYMKTWKPSIHMPKDAARIWLEVTDVRVERLQDISEEDAVKEGILMNPVVSMYADVPVRGWKNYLNDDWFISGNGRQSPEDQSFQSLWQSINGLESWQLNPWVWVVSYKVLSTTGREGTERKEAVAV